MDSPARKTAKNYFFIAQHYKFALDKVFNEYGYKTVLITEGICIDITVTILNTCFFR